MSKESGFTLIEIIVSLVIAEIMVAVAGMGLTTGIKGYVFARENAHMAQKAQLALVRLNREFMELLDITTPTASSIIYELTTGDRAIAKVGDTIKIRDGSALPDAANGDILVDNVNNFTLTYYKAGSTWVPGTDSIQYLSAIQINLVLDRADSGIGTLTFSTTVHPRNTKNYGGAAPTDNPPTKSNYGCFVTTMARNIPSGYLNQQLKTYAAISVVLIFILSFFSMVFGSFKEYKRRFRSGVLNEKGSLLIGLIATMLIFSVLGAAMLPLTSTSTFSQIGMNSSTRAYFLAESAYRYAASEYLNAGDENARDAALTALNNQTYTLADNDGQFHIDIYSHWFKTTADPIGTRFLSTTVPGGLPSGMNLGRGFLQIDGTVYGYRSVVVSDPNVTFRKNVGNWPSIPVGTRVSNVARSQNSSQTVTKDGDLVFRRNNRGANAFALRNGQFQVNGNTYNYKELDLANRKLKGITDPDDDNMPAFIVAGNSWIVLEDFVKVQCTGTFAPGSGMETSRTITYSTPIGWVSRVEEASAKTEVTDSFADTSNWQSSTFGSHAVATEDGSNALDVTGTSNVGSSVTSLIAFDWTNTDADLASTWDAAGKLLSYDVQVKTKMGDTTNYMAGISLRADNSVPEQYGVSFLKSDPSGVDGIPDTLVPIQGQLMVVLWQQTDSSTRKWLAYKTLSSSDYIETNINLFFDDMESGTSNWTAQFPWAPTTSAYHSITTSWKGRFVGSFFGWFWMRTSLTLDIQDLSTANAVILEFWHKRLASGNDSATVEISSNGGSSWSTLATYTGNANTWQQESFDISSYLSAQVRVRFRTHARRPWTTTDGWWVDDVTISGQAVDWPTMVVRIEEKVASSGRFSGQKVNDIQTFIGDVNAHGTAGTDSLDNNRKANPRGSINWPPDDVVDTDSTNDYYTLVQWNSSIDSSVDRLGTGNELNTIIRSNALTTPGSGSFTQDEVALHTWGGTSTSVFFDDFAIQLAATSGGGVGFLNPIQE